MNKRRGKKGFTIAELVIVIVVIAVLAAVLIPLFANLIEKAKLSVDQQTVDGMNKVLIADEALSGKPKSLNAAKAVLESNNYRGNIAPTAKDHEFYWIPADNRVVLVKMNGDSPKSIVYPKNLAEKYADESPAEWYKLSESSDVETCLHESKRYVAIADGNTSTAHMEICSECNTVTINSEAHDTIGTNGACSKCGWKAPADGDSHVHAYTTVFLSDCNGHHYGVCSCGVLGPSEACAYDANGVCEKCHYAKPTTGDEHEHKFTYTPNSPYNGKHKKTCTVEGCDISGAEENCAYGLNKKCIYCGADMPGQGGSEQHTHSYGEWTSNGNGTHSRSCSCGVQQTEDCKYENKVCTVCGYSKVRNGLVDGIYYKDDEPLTGTDKGYTFRDGHLVLTGTKGTPTKSGSYMDQKLTFDIPTDEAFLTDKIILIFDDCNNYLQPGSYGGNEIQVTNASNYATVSIKAEGLDSLKNAINALRSAIQEGNTTGILQTIETQYGITENSYPLIVASDDFIAYMGTLGVTMTNSSKLTAAQYQTYLNAVADGKTYVSYLKNKYSVSSLSNLSWATRVNYEDSFRGSWPNTNTAGAHGLFDGTESDYRIAEPEFVLLTLEHYYNKIAFVGVSDSDPSSVVGAAGNEASRFYKYDTEAWMDGVASEYGVKLYSLIQASDGQFFNVSDMNQFFVFTAQHGFLMTNAFQNFEGSAPSFEIILEKTN